MEIHKMGIIAAAPATTDATTSVRFTASFWCKPNEADRDTYG